MGIGVAGLQSICRGTFGTPPSSHMCRGQETHTDVSCRDHAENGVAGSQRPRLAEGDCGELWQSDWIDFGGELYKSMQVDFFNRTN